MELRDGTTLEPYAVYAYPERGNDDPTSCTYCDEGADWSFPIVAHVHEMYESRGGVSWHTADELADLFLDACETYASPWKRPEDCPRDVTGWLDDPDASQWLSDCARDGESALSDVGLSVWWDDGYVIERVTEA